MYPVESQHYMGVVMDMISATERCERLVKISLVNEKKRYNIMLHKLSEKYIQVGNLETKVEGLEEEKRILIDMVREEQHNVWLLKEDLNRSKNMVQQEIDVSRIRAELQARIGGETVSRVEDIGDTVTRTILSSPDDEEESNDDTRSEKIDEEQQKDMDRMLDDNDEEKLVTEETGTLDEDTNTLLDESTNIVCDASSVDQEECNNCHNFVGNSQEITIHIKNCHFMEHVSNKQIELEQANLEHISGNVSNSQYEDLETHIDKLLKTYGIKNQIDTNAKDKGQSFNDFDFIGRLSSEPEETNSSVEAPEDEKEDKEIAKKKVFVRKSSKRPRDHILKDKPLDSEEPLQKKKTKRCGSCEGCLRSECNKCKACLDKPRNGGRNTVRQKCYRRKCTFAP